MTEILLATVTAVTCLTLLFTVWRTTKLSAEQTKSLNELADRLLDAVIAKNGIDAAAIERLRKAKPKPRRDKSDRPGEWFSS